MKIYPYWKIKDNDKLVLRFLPDSNKNNLLGFFKQVPLHKIIVKGKTKSVLCEKILSGDYCIFHDAGSPLRVVTIANVLILKDPLGISTEKETFLLYPNYQIVQGMKDGFLNLNETPSHYRNGYNFRITKSIIDSNFSNYKGSFNKKHSSLTNEQISLAESSLVDLRTFFQRATESDMEQAREQIIFQRLKRT